MAQLLMYVIFDSTDDDNKVNVRRNKDLPYVIIIFINFAHHGTNGVRNEKCQSNPIILLFFFIAIFSVIFLSSSSSFDITKELVSLLLSEKTYSLLIVVRIILRK